MNTHTIKSLANLRKAVYGMMAIGFAYALSFFIYPTLLPDTTKATAGVATTPTLEISPSNNVSFSVTPGTFNSASQTLSVSTTNYTGYKLTLSADSSADLVGTDGAIPTITLPSGSSSITSSSITNGYGYSLDATNYKPVLTGEGSTLDTTSVANTTANDYTLTFGANVDRTIPAGSYTKALTLTATANDAGYVITYDANADSDTVTGMPSPNPNQGTISGLSVSISNATPERFDYTFLGWDEDDEATEPTYEAGDTFTLDPETANSKTLYAIWERNTYNITYNANSGSGSMSSVSHTNILKDSSVNLYASNFNRANYGFAGWSTDPNAANDIANATIYGPNETITLSSDIIATADSNHNIVLYAVWVPSTYSLQAFASSNQCADMSEGEIIALRDTRDSNVYTVAKLADGSCWMTENLRLNIQTASIAPNNTNSPTTTFLGQKGAATLRNCTDATAACIDQVSFSITNTNNYVSNSNVSYNGTNQSNSWYSYGGMYNWYTATAGHGIYSKYSGNADGDICPSGWQLPTGGTQGDFYYLGDQLGAASSNATSSNIWRSFPNNFVYSGTYNGSTAPGRGTYAHYWSSTASNNGNGYSFYLSNTQVGRNTNRPKYEGSAVRCLTGRYKLDYNANGGSNAPTTSQRSFTATFDSIEETEPTRSGYTFSGWMDKSGNEAQPGESFTATRANTTLYALWTNDACNPDATTISEAVCLQDMNLDVKNSMTSKTSYTLKDARNNTPYSISKLDDGNVWMTANLKYTPGANRLHTHYDTDVPIDAPFIHFVSGSPFSTFETTGSDIAYVSPRYNSNSSGPFYSYAAAIASTESVTGNIASSICPKGWNLPRFSDYTNLQQRASLTTYALASASPYNFRYTGLITGGTTVNSATSLIRLWTATANPNTAYASQVYSTSTVSLSKHNGAALRCIASNGTGTIHFEANGGTGTMSDQIAEIGMDSVKRNSFTAPNEKGFKEWNTQADGNGISLGQGGTITSSLVSVGGSVTLYAQWEYAHGYSYNSNGGTGSMYYTTAKVLEGDVLKLEAPNFKRADYGFAGWSTDPNAANDIANATIYGPNETITIPNYENDDAITFYAVWVPKDTTYNLQTFASANRCSTMSEGDIIALQDSRDSNVYTVAKLADGNCWMTENLRLDPSDSNTTITADNTNNPTSTFINTDLASITTPYFKTCTANDAACNDQLSFGLGNINGTTTNDYSGTSQTASWYSYGGMYNWYTATAGHGTYSKTSSDGAMAGDICPKGWHLPYGGNGTGTKGGNTDGGFYYLGSQLGATSSNATSSNIWRSFPNNFVYSGRYSATSASSRGTSGYYWSSTANSNASGYGLYFASSSVSPGTLGNHKYFGQAVRCVADKHYMQDVTDWGSSVSVGDTVEAVDNRDNTTYTVARLDDGNLWMTQNLRLDLGSATITAQNTNNPTEDFLRDYTGSESTSNWCTYNFNSNDTECMYQINYNTDFNDEESIGSYYNWYAATAGNGTYDFDQDGDSTSGDICPSGWHLPTQSEFANLSSALNDDPSTLMNAPNNFDPSGFLDPDNDIPYDLYETGYWWSSTAYNNIFAESFILNENSLNTEGYNKSLGLTVRCVAKESGGN